MQVTAANFRTEQLNRASRACLCWSRWRCEWRACSNPTGSVNFQFHDGMNFPHSVVGNVLSTVALIFRSMAYVPERFPNNGDDRGISDFQPFSRTSLKWKSRG